MLRPIQLTPYVKLLSKTIYLKSRLQASKAGRNKPVVSFDIRLLLFQRNTRSMAMCSIEIFVGQGKEQERVVYRELIVISPGNSRGSRVQVLLRDGGRYRRVAPRWVEDLTG